MCLYLFCLFYHRHVEITKFFFSSVAAIFIEEAKKKKMSKNDKGRFYFIFQINYRKMFKSNKMIRKGQPITWR